MELAVINSGITHRNTSGGYNQRRRECEQACEILGLGSLRELEFNQLADVNRLPEPLNRRARHVITENERVLRAVDALRSSDCITLGRLFNESHDSMRDDYEVSVADIDTLVLIARHQPEIFGARLTGGGFGGSIVFAAEVGTARATAERVAALYCRSTGREPHVIVPQLDSEKETESEVMSKM